MKRADNAKREKGNINLLSNLL